MNQPTRQRRRAQAGATARPGSEHKPPRQAAKAAPSHAELLHELAVRQVELELQNDELRRAQLDLAAARDRFVDLYDFAPVAYFTLDSDGMVLEANLTAATVLGKERKALVGRGFARFVTATHAQQWHRHLRLALQHDGVQRIELVMLRHPGGSFQGQLDSLRVAPADGAQHSLRVTLTDITQRKQAEMDRRIADNVVDAREAERRKIARELHEGLGQRLSALKMDLSSLDTKPDPQGRGARIATMLDTLDEALASVRRMAIDLRPPMLDDLGLAAAIDWLAHDAGRRLGLQIAIDVQDIEPALDERASIAVYRMVQQILDHVGRDGQAGGVAIALVQQAPELVLTVRCNAAGRPAQCRWAADGAATQSLLDQAHMLGGVLAIDDAPGHGPCLTVRMPRSRTGDRNNGQLPDGRATDQRQQPASIGLRAKQRNL